uniref:Phosphopyruvate hydratase n=1 Tax=Ascaris lumbricoides TaxID=6252 RepID=A0A0M3HI55_ASCLU
MKCLETSFTEINDILKTLFFEKGAETVHAYLPTSATWYSLRDGDYGETVFSGNMSAKKTEMIPVLARGGVIIPRQPPNTTTTASRRNPFDLLIAVAYFAVSLNKMTAGASSFMRCVN